MTADNGHEIWTIGHWTCPEETFIRSLRSSRIDLLVDVRSLPGSRRNPQFNKESMRHWLDDAGIGYLHSEDLGGRRPAQGVDKNRNAGWQKTSFKNYADYTLMPSYGRGIERLIELATTQRVAYMCGEPMPWRCHRLLISNTLVARGWTVWHIFGDGAPRMHEMGAWGAVPVVDANGLVTYPPVVLGTDPMLSGA